MTSETHADTAVLGIRRSLEASIIRSCNGCGAPGTFQSHESIKLTWPGCHVEASHPDHGKPVGAVCPHCDTPRHEAEPLGEIWSTDRKE